MTRVYQIHEIGHRLWWLTLTEAGQEALEDKIEELKERGIL